MLVVLDELKFWGEVMTEFLEVDASASDRHMLEMRKEVREQIEEAERIDKELAAQGLGDDSEEEKEEAEEDDEN